MNTPLFFFYWISFSILVLIASVIAFFVSRRKGCFRDQDRTRYLPLWAEVPRDKEVRKERREKSRS